jgi:predicted Zn-dependent peptidase
MLAKPIVDESVLKNLLADVIKSRNDEKLQKQIILNRAMLSYARYGSTSPFSYVLTDEEVNKITAEEINNKIKSLLNFEHKVLYYGPKEIDDVKSLVNAMHNAPDKLLPAPPSYNFTEKYLDNTVYLIDFDMTQVEIMMLSNGNKYDVKNVPIIALYNNYFGGGMSSIVFQDLRESKALAYSTYSRYMAPNKFYKTYFNSSYIGSQADKLAEALKGLSSLLNDMPNSESGFNSSKEMILQEMRTQRITKTEILFNYLNAENLGNKTDTRKDIYNQVQNYTLDDVQKFQKENIKGKPTTVLVLGKKDALDLKELEKYGTIKFLTLKDVFGF